MARIPDFNREEGAQDRRGAIRRHRPVLAAIALMVVVFGGAFGFMAIEGWPFLALFFFTLITVTTVGYGAEGLSETGERFTALLLIGGIGTATYAFGVIVQASVVAQLSWRRNMHRQIKRMSEHFIVCGFGRIGRPVAERLEASDVSCVVVEGSHDAVQEARERGFLAILGNATEDEVLLEAGIERAKGIVCAVNSDADNIVIALGARELRPDIQIVARVDEDGATRKIRRAGANQVVSPFRTAAMDIANNILQPNVTNLLSQAAFAEGGFELSELNVGGDPFEHVLTLGALRGPDSTDIVFVAIKHENGTTTLGPTDDDELRKGDVIIVAGEPLTIRRVTARLSLGQMNGGKQLRTRRELTSWGPVAPPD